MADANYVTAVGFVQFDPVTRDANGKSVTDAVIKTPGNGVQIRLTIWPEIKLPRPLKKGDFLAVDGKFTTSTYQKADGSSATGNQISAYNIAILGEAAAREDREVVGGSSAAASSDVPF